MASESISFTVTFRGVSHALAVPTSTTLAELHILLEELTDVPPVLQKLLYRNKKSANDVERITITQAGLKDGMKVQMLGSTTQELDGLRTLENEHTRVERILRERALKAPVKVSSLLKLWRRRYIISLASINWLWTYINICLVLISCITISFPQYQTIGSSARSFICSRTFNQTFRRSCY